MCAAAGHQGGLLGQSLRQLVGLPGPAQLAIAERRCAPGSSLFGDRRAEGRHPSAPPAGVDTVLTQDDAAQLGHHLLADGHLEKTKKLQHNLLEPVPVGPLRACSDGGLGNCITASYNL